MSSLLKKAKKSLKRCCCCCGGGDKSDDVMGGGSDGESDGGEEQVYVVHALRRDLNAEFHYPKNTIRTAKYTLLTMVPLSILYQFEKLSNVYFLTVMIITLIPGTSPINPFSSIVPTCIVLGIGVIKDLYEDYRRRRSDSRANNSLARVLTHRGGAPIGGDGDDGCCGALCSCHNGFGSCFVNFWKTLCCCADSRSGSTPALSETYGSHANAGGGGRNNYNHDARNGGFAYQTDHVDRRASYEGSDPGSDMGGGGGGQGLLYGNAGPAYEFTLRPSRLIQAGDIVLLTLGEEVRADCMVLATSLPDGLTYIETSSLDGETSKKTRRARPETSLYLSTVEDIVEAALQPIPRRLLVAAQRAATAMGAQAGAPAAGAMNAEVAGALTVLGSAPNTDLSSWFGQLRLCLDYQRFSNPLRKRAPSPLPTDGAAPTVPYGTARDEQRLTRDQQQQVRAQRQQQRASSAGTAGPPVGCVEASPSSRDDGGSGVSGGSGNGDDGVLTVAMGIDQFLPRGAIVCNTDWVLAMVLYTGNNTKMLLNMRATPKKRTWMLYRLNIMNVVLFLINMVLMLIMSGLSIWGNQALKFSGPFAKDKLPNLKTHYTSWYVQWSIDRFSDARLFWWRFLTYFVLISYLIPLSLYVTLELTKAAQMGMIAADRRLAVWQRNPHYDPKVAKAAAEEKKRKKALAKGEKQENASPASPSAAAPPPPPPLTATAGSMGHSGLSKQEVRKLEKEARRQQKMAKHKLIQKRSRPRTSELNSQLALVRYIFTDKTGTLTENQMVYRGGTVNIVVHDEAATPAGLGCHLLSELQAVAAQAVVPPGGRAPFAALFQAHGGGHHSRSSRVRHDRVLSNSVDIFAAAAQRSPDVSSGLPRFHPPHERVLSSSVDIFAASQRSLEAGSAPRGSRLRHSRVLSHSGDIFAVSQRSLEAGEAMPPLAGSRVRRARRGGKRETSCVLTEEEEHALEESPVFRYLRLMALCHTVVCFATESPEEVAAAAPDAAAAPNSGAANTASGAVHVPNEALELSASRRRLLNASADVGGGGDGFMSDNTSAVPDSRHARGGSTLGAATGGAAAGGDEARQRHYERLLEARMSALALGRDVIYDGPSLDEIALVRAARQNGVSLYERTAKQIFINVLGRSPHAAAGESSIVLCYDIVAECEFTPERKLMSILLRRNRAGDGESSVKAVAGREVPHYHRRPNEPAAYQQQQQQPAAAAGSNAFGALPTSDKLGGGDGGEARQAPRREASGAGVQVPLGAPAALSRSRRREGDDGEAAFDMSVDTSALTSAIPSGVYAPAAEAEAEAEEEEEEEYLLLVKGADSSMFDIMRRDGAANVRMKPILDGQLQAFGKQGHRTLVLGERRVPRSEAEAWLPVLHAAQCAMTGRKEKLHAAYALMERDVDIVGSTAVEDRLQAHVPETLQSFAAAGIIVWMLTGDKRETAVTIAKTSGLLPNTGAAAVAPAPVLQEDGSIVIAGGGADDTGAGGSGGGGDAEDNLIHLDLTPMMEEEARHYRAEQQDEEERKQQQQPRAQTPEPRLSFSTGSSQARRNSASCASETEAGSPPPPLLAQREGTAIYRDNSPDAAGDDDGYGRGPTTGGRRSIESVFAQQRSIPERGCEQPEKEAPQETQTQMQTQQHTQQQPQRRFSAAGEGRLRAELRRQLEDAQRRLDARRAQGGGAEKVMVLVVDGKTLDVVFEDAELQRRFFEVGDQCHSAVCCRLSPLQKGAIVRVFKKNIKRKECSVLGIGDGANDCNLIQESDIGIGVMGLEGSQAEMCSDYAIVKFYLLRRLLFVHGRFSFFRDAHCVLYSLYRNINLTVGMTAYCCYSSFSGQSFMDSWLIGMFNLLFCALQPLVIGVLDKDVDDELAEVTPALYPVMRREKTYFNVPYILKWCFDATVEGFAIFFLLYWTVCVREDLFSDYRSDSIEAYGETYFTMLVLIIDVRGLAVANAYTALLAFCLWIEVAGILIIELVYSSFEDLAGSNRSVYTAMELWFRPSGKFYMMLFYAGGVLLLCSLASQAAAQLFGPMQPWGPAALVTNAARRSNAHRCYKRQRAAIKAEVKRRRNANPAVADNASSTRGGLLDNVGNGGGGDIPYNTTNSHTTTRGELTQGTQGPPLSQQQQQQQGGSSSPHSPGPSQSRGGFPNRTTAVYVD